MKTNLKNFIELPAYSLEQLLNEEITLFQFEIDGSKLEKPNYNITGKIDYAVSISPIIEKIRSIDKPCIYWFDAENETKAIEMIKERLKFSFDYPIRSAPKPNSHKNSKCLYVGIRQGGMRKRDNFSNIAGRIVIHCGYYHVGSTQGLNLAYWAKEKITLNIIELPHEASIYLNIIEKMLAKKLKPVLGRH
jgi:hypothetical protein